MKKEITTTTITATEAATSTNIKNQGEKVMKKDYALQKFTDEESFHYGDRLEETYAERERIIKGFYENYVLGAVKGTEQYKEYVEQGFSDKIDRVVEIADVIMDYLTEFVVTGRGWQSLITNLTDCKGAVIEGVCIFNIVSDAVSMATFAIDGKYKKIRVNKSYFRLYKHVSEEYVKTGEYDEKTGEIEVYIPENYEFESAEKWLREHDAGDLYEMAVELMEEKEELEERNIENQEEKDMKKEMIIDMVESTYEIVGKARTISNCTGIDESKEEEFLGREDRAVMAAEYIFGHSEKEESENEKLLVDYYKNQPEDFFESWTDDDIAGEGLVERMAKDLLSAKANAPEFDKSDRMKLSIQDMYGVKLYRAEFLRTYRKLDTRDDVMEDYLTNFLTSYMTWHSLMIQTDGWHLLMRKFYGHDGVYEPMLDCEPIFADGTEGEQHVYSWADYVSDVTAWLYGMMKIALVCGTYAPNGKYKTVTYEGYEDWYMDTLDIRRGAEEKVHAYDEERDFQLYKIEPEKVDFDTISDFMIKFKYEEPKPVEEITRDELRELDDDELDEYFYSRRAYNEGIGKKKAYYRAA